jgi:dolichol-phosphate mannosyltransferase
VRWLCSERFIQFIKFCLVGGSGVFVDMGILYLLADPSRLGGNITLSKICAAEVAMINNFIWNELWTFKASSLSSSTEERAGVRSRAAIRQSKIENRTSKIAGRFLLFNAICGIGIGLAVLLLHLFHTWLGWNLYLSNFLAIILVTLWNFRMNAQFTWYWRQRTPSSSSSQSE